MKKIIFLVVFLLAPLLVSAQADCNDVAACNYDSNAAGSSECLYSGDPCDDGNMSTTNDIYDGKCDCFGIANLPANFTIEDACSCINPEHMDTDGDGQIDLFYETLVITSSPGETWSVSNINGLLDANGDPIVSLTATEVSPGNYVANFYHQADTGYSSTWSNGMSTLIVFNSCEACTAAAAVPTMSQWGLILLALSSMTLMFLFVLAGQKQLTTSTGMNVSMVDWKNLKTYPFEKESFHQALKLTIGLLLGIAIFAILVYGYFTPADIIGLALSAPLFTYMIHLILSSNKVK